MKSQITSQRAWTLAVVGGLVAMGCSLDPPGGYSGSPTKKDASKGTITAPADAIGGAPASGATTADSIGTRTGGTGTGTGATGSGTAPAGGPEIPVSGALPGSGATGILAKPIDVIPATALVSNGAGTNLIVASVRAPALALAHFTLGDRLAAWLIPPVGAEMEGFDTDPVASASVLVTDVATGSEIAQGSTNAQGNVAIAKIPSNSLVKIEVSKPGGPTIAAIVRTPVAAASQSYDLGSIGTNNTIAAAFFQSGDIDSRLLDLVDNDVINFLADLIKLKLDDDFKEGGKDRNQLAAGLKKHKKDKDKPKNSKGEREDEDAETSENPVRKILNELGIGEGDKTLLKIAVNPALAPSIAKLAAEKQQSIILRTAFLLQHQDERETKKADEAEAATDGLATEKPKAFLITTDQVKALVSATGKYTPAHIIHGLLRVKGMSTLQIGTTTVDVGQAILNTNKNKKILDGFKAWEKVNGAPVGIDTVINNPVARLLIALRASKKSEDAFKEALKPHRDQIRRDSNFSQLRDKILRKPLRITSQADMDGLLAELSRADAGPVPTPAPQPLTSSTPQPGSAKESPKPGNTTKP